MGMVLFAFFIHRYYIKTIERAISVQKSYYSNHRSSCLAFAIFENTPETGSGYPIISQYFARNFAVRALRMVIYDLFLEIAKKDESESPFSLRAFTA